MILMVTLQAFLCFLCIFLNFKCELINIELLLFIRYYN